MVYLGGPGGEEFAPRETGHLYDHERRALDRFRCPVCDAPLELMESAPASVPIASDDACDLVAACRFCDVTFTRDDWHAWLGAA